MINLILIRPYSAIPPWEGYKKQGHVALFIALQKIRDLLNENKRDDLSEFCLGIEGEEDVFIKRGDRYLSLHQVKSGNSSFGQKDKFCFIISVLQYEAKRGFFHKPPEARLDSNFVKATDDMIKVLKAQYSREIVNKSELDKSAAEDGYIIIENLSGNLKKSEKYDILKHILKQNDLKHDKSDIAEGVKLVITDLERYEAMLLDDDGTLKDDSQFLDIHNDALNAEDASYSVISEILGDEDPSWVIGTNDIDRTNYCRAVYEQILLYLERKITESKDAVALNCNICLKDIHELINIDGTTLKGSVPYQYRMVWKCIHESLKGFPEYNKCESNSCAECPNSDSCNLHKQSRRIGNIDKSVAHDFLYKLMLKSPVIDKPNNLPDKELIDDIFVSLLKEAECLKIEDNRIVQAQKNGQIYRASLNNSRKKEILWRQLSDEAEKANDDILLIYEADVLITGQLNADHFMFGGNSVMVFGKNEYDELSGVTSDSIYKSSKNCTKPKNKKLIDASKAKEELK